jgi:hypothetical protein
MKTTSDLTNLTTAILILTVQMFIEWTLLTYIIQGDSCSPFVKNFQISQNGINMKIFSRL